MRSPKRSLLPLVLLAAAGLTGLRADAAPLAAGKTKFLGCAYSTPQAPGFATYFNQVTPENAGKWGSVEATRDTMNWTELDTAYDFARTNGFKFRFHILVWGSQQPSWIDALTTAEKLDEIKEWYAAVAARYPDLDYIEVVNEPLHAPPNGETIAFSTNKAANYADALGGSGASGWDWILESFRLARQYFPGKKLVLNEYGLLGDANAMGRYVQIINLLKAENLVDVVSVQAHSFETKDQATQTLAANLATLAATNLPVMITEMDIDDTTAKPQLADYQRIFPLFWEHPSVVGITLWGYRPGMWRESTGATLVASDGTEKPAMTWLKQYVQNHLPVVTAGQTFRVASGSPNQTLLGMVQATDGDAGAALQDWSITGGTGAAAVVIDASTGALRLSDVSKLDFNTTASYTVTVKVGDGIGHAVPVDVTLVAGKEPAFTTQPTAASVSQGAALSLTSVATSLGSADPTTYQWQFSADGSSFAAIAGATSANYSVASAAYANTGQYRVVATNSYGAATSAAVFVNVAPVQVAALRTDGFGAASTGGGTAATANLTVTTAAALRVAATSSEARVITIAGTVDIGTLDLASNKTIQGADSDAALLGTLRIGAGVTNVVVRGLTLSSPAGDALVVAGATKVFVTRCSFLDSAGHQLAITDGADQVTVSWCEFTFASAAAANRSSVLIGKAGTETKALHVTMHHNRWHGPVDRDMPSATSAYLHLYNNVFGATGNTSGTVADNQTQLLNERNFYTGMKDPLAKRQTDAAKAGALVRTISSDYDACTGAAPDAGADNVFVPTYGYALRPSGEARTPVTSGAGNLAGASYTEAGGPSAAISGPTAAVVPATTLTLTASATGGTATAYQWRRGGTPLAGATSASYSATMSSTEAGTYSVEATLASGELVVSAPFTVTLGAEPPPPTAPPATGGSSSGGGGALGLGLGGALAVLAALRRSRR